MAFGGVGTFVFGLILFQFVALNEARALDTVVSTGIFFMTLGGAVVIAANALR